jgi:hypothetical protein
LRIVFLCGSLETGCDGVGDYTRRLAIEMIRQGHIVSAVAINDRYLTNHFEGTEEIEGINLPLLRMPSIMPPSEKFQQVKKWLSVYNPQWISLQFVPYSFDVKGLPLRLSKDLVKLGKEYKWHIMFHELWVGLNGSSSIKQKLLATIQKFIIERLLSDLRPGCITTSIPLYQKHLRKSNAKILPLFSNIPITNFERNVITEGDLINKGLTAIHFGNFTSAIMDFKMQLEFIRKISELRKDNVRLIVLGEGGPFKDLALKTAEQILGENSVVNLGSLTTEKISQHLQKADIGISRANYAMFGKSGSTIAMLEHGLPVVLRGKESNVVKDSSEIYKYNRQLISYVKEYLEVPKKLPPKSSLKEIGETFAKYLSIN